MRSMTETCKGLMFLDQRIEVINDWNLQALCL